MIEIKTNYINENLLEDIVVDIISDCDHLEKDHARSLFDLNLDLTVCVAMKCLYMNREYDTTRAKVLFDFVRANNPEFYNPERDGIIQYYFG